MRKLTFTNGDQLAAIGLGTWKSAPGEVGRAIISALEAGYRHLDCAAIYGNEDEIGDALQEAFQKGIVKREELWVTSKLWNNSHARSEILPAIRKTLNDLKLDYIDLYLVHWPVALQPGVAFPKSKDDFRSLEQIPLLETWGGMEELHKKGLARHIGVSNFSIRKLNHLLERAEHAPEMNQVELHPYLQQKDLLQFAKNKGVFLTAYSPLGSRDRPERLKKEGDPDLLDVPVVVEIAEDMDCTPAQVLIAWAVQRGTAVIPKSTHPKRLRENLAAGEIELPSRHMDRLAGLDKHFRFIDGGTWAENNPYYTLANLWDE